MPPTPISGFKTYLGRFKQRNYQIVAVIVLIVAVAVAVATGYHILATGFHQPRPTAVLPSASPSPSDSPTPSPSDSPTPSTAAIATRTPAPAPTATANLCRSGQYANVGGKATCSYTFQASDVPARFQASGLQSAPRQSVYSAVTLSAVCVDDGACAKTSDNSAVSSESNSAIDWRITRPTQIAITVNASIITADTPHIAYNFDTFEYNHPSIANCTEENLYCYSLSAVFDKL